jgi:hypothetical protein
MLFFALDNFKERRMLACFSRDRPGMVYHRYLPLGGHGYVRDRMWAQYADNHRGVCLFFDRATLESTFHEQMAKHGIALAGDVSYCDQVALAVAPHDTAEYERIGRTAWLKQMGERVAKECSFVKRSDWESEQEYRLLFIPDSSPERRAQETIWIRGALAAICVGDRFPEGLLPCIRAVCDREKINAFRMRYIGDPSVEPLYPTKQPYPSPFLNSLRDQ